MAEVIVKAASTGSGSSENDSRPVGLSVLSDADSKVRLKFQVPGLKKKRSFFDTIFTCFKKPSSPSRFLANALFEDFTLTATSLSFTLKRKRKGNENRVDVFVCSIKQFPTTINPDFAQFEVFKPASGECFIVLTLLKTDNLNVNWKEFLFSNGTIDASTL